MEHRFNIQPAGNPPCRCTTNLMGRRRKGTLLDTSLDHKLSSIFMLVNPFSGNEECGGSFKRSRNTEEGGYSTPETPTSGGSTSQRPIGRDAAKTKGKSKFYANILAEEIHAFRLTRDIEVDIMKKKYELEQQKKQKKKKRK
ncbi:uncharacterized protein LOC110889757 [Helianthus annuus]|uniref:uncharacterized protein LOC110889757 n=1 Tax=Helianthus annuus TaxID=4232 RepID=UPI001652C2CF|nr:uncharacterized protein LOC110889757 [Helianthus annuus]XP_035835514.1 uncharacterized protein LOC110889757 [Helianthus annuus]